MRTDAGVSLTRAGDLVKIVSGVVAAAGSIWLLLRGFAQLVTLDSRRSAKTFLDTRSDPMEDLADQFQWIIRQAPAPVLLVVDDLDRCPQEFVVELLDSVQKLMRDRSGARGYQRGRATPSDPLLVVVAADGRWIRASYDATFSEYRGAVARPGSTVGSLFLEKSFS